MTTTKICKCTSMQTQKEQNKIFRGVSWYKEIKEKKWYISNKKLQMILKWEKKIIKTYPKKLQ